MYVRVDMGCYAMKDTVNLQRYIIIIVTGQLR